VRSGPRRGLLCTGITLLVLLEVPVLSSQAPPRSLKVLVIDRDLSSADFDDPAWSEAPAARELVQQEPNEGQPATLETECRVVATPRALLLRFVMEEPAAEFVANELRRDADLSNDDRVAFVLDTYHDRRNAYFFATNPNGAREDGLVTEESDPSLDWDTVWDVHVRRTPRGWDALFRIPFAALNFPGGEDGVWGFNFSRILRRRTETVRWTGWQRPFALSKVSLAGELAGLPALTSRRLLNLTPYALARFEDLRNPADRNLLGKGGFDFRYGLTSSTEADLTANTDFAETEADAPQFNFGRTSLFFPEKRLFFLQRSQIFAFGNPETTLPFFSRRIGLADVNSAFPQPIPIDAGLKITGRLGRTDFGTLAVQTRAAGGEPRTDFFAGRGKFDLGHASYVGALFTDLERPPGSAPAYSRTFGADALVNLTPEWTANGFYVRTSNPGASGETSAWQGEVRYHGAYANASVLRSDIGSAYDPEAGFVSQNGIHENLMDFELTPRPHALGLQNLSFEGFGLFKYNENGTLNEREYQYTFRAIWLSGAYTDDDIVDVLDENLTEPLALTATLTIPPGLYHFVRHQVAFGTDPSRRVAFQANFNFGDYYGGRRDRYVGRLFVKPSEHVAVSLIEDYNVVRLPQGDFNLSLFSARIDWNASVRLLSSFTLQTDNVDHLTNAQAILRWLIDPATDLFAVYERQVGAGFERPGTRVSLKFRRAFDL
jgi:uncharacterized protein DUF5916